MRPAQIPGCCREAAGAGTDRQPTTWRPSGAGAPRAVVCSRVTTSLSLYNRVHPTAREERVFREAVAFARTLGLRVPPRFCEVYWVRGEAHEYPGITYHLERPVRVYLRQGLSGVELLTLVWHELQHVHDAQYPEMEKWQREE